MWAIYRINVCDTSIKCCICLHYSAVEGSVITDIEYPERRRQWKNSKQMMTVFMEEVGAELVFHRQQAVHTSVATTTLGELKAWEDLIPGITLVN